MVRKHSWGEYFMWYSLRSGSAAGSWQVAAAQQEGGSSPLLISPPQTAPSWPVLSVPALSRKPVWLCRNVNIPMLRMKECFQPSVPRSSDLRCALCYVLINTQELKSAVNAPGEVWNAVCGSGLTAWRSVCSPSCWRQCTAEGLSREIHAWNRSRSPSCI